MPHRRGFIVWLSQHYSRWTETGLNFLWRDFHSVWIISYSEGLHATYPPVYCLIVEMYFIQQIFIVYSLTNTVKTACGVSTYQFINKHIALLPLSSLLNLICTCHPMIQLPICMKTGDVIKRSACSLTFWNLDRLHYIINVNITCARCFDLIVAHI